MQTIPPALFSVLVASLLIAATPVFAKVNPFRLVDLQWKKRVILVYAQEPELSRAKANLEEFAAGVRERDIAWFVMNDASLHSNYPLASVAATHDYLSRHYFGAQSATPQVILIGKDGTVKSRGSDLDLAATFGLIDRMPMRRAEMQHETTPHSGR